jgi:hypothetical protein
MNYLMPSDLFAHLLSASGGGYWGKIAERGKLIGGESIGVYSYSRVATGFFLGISTGLIVGYFRKWYAKIPLIALIFVGILFTGSRTGLASFGIIILFIFFSKKHFLPICISVVIFMTSFVFLFPFIQNDKVMGRFAGTSITYQDSVYGRFERHKAVLTLPFNNLLIGTGLGNLGSALNANENQMATKFYRAHGYVFTYLGEIGLIGSLLLAYAVFQMIYSVPKPLTKLSLGIIFATLFSGFTDDFMIPAASGGHLAIIVVVAFRMGLIDGIKKRQWCLK